MLIILELEGQISTKRIISFFNFMAGILADGKESPQYRVTWEFFLVFLGKSQKLKTEGGESENRRYVTGMGKKHE